MFLWCSIKGWLSWLLAVRTETHTQLQPLDSVGSPDWFESQACMTVSYHGLFGVELLRCRVGNFLDDGGDVSRTVQMQLWEAGLVGLHHSLDACPQSIHKADEDTDMTVGIIYSVQFFKKLAPYVIIRDCSLTWGHQNHMRVLHVLDV